MEKQIIGSFHIAVTGHRFIPNGPKLDQAIRQAFQHFLALHKSSTIILYSALAEGSDQLTAKIAQDFKEIILHVPLPMMIELYLKDFSSDEGRESFHTLLSTAERVIHLSPSPNHQDSYQALGTYLVNQANILLALWNGVYNQQKGGTSEIVKAALQAKKIVYWIYCPNLKLGEDNELRPQKQIGDLEILMPDN